MHYLNGARPKASAPPFPGWHTLPRRELSAPLIDAVWQRIRHARLPVLWAGAEIRHLGLHGVLQQIAAASGLPFATLRQPALAPIDADLTAVQPRRALLSASDCVMVLGTVVSADYLDIMAASYGSMIEIDPQQARIGYAQYSQVDLDDFLYALLARFQQADYIAKTILLAA